MPRWSISAKDVKDNALLAELFADFEGFPGDAIRACRREPMGVTTWETSFVVYT